MDNVKLIINKMSKGQIIYETKRGKKIGLTLHQWIEKKLKDKEKNKVLTRVEQERNIWKKYHVDISAVNQKGKSVGIQELPLFDVSYYLSKDYVKGVSTQSSKEMMEWFLKCYGDVSSLDLEDNANNPDQYDKKAVWLGWRNLTYGFDSGEPYKWFAELEHLITNNDMFWTLFNRIWTNGSHYMKCKQMFETIVLNLF